jgi:hypothetical protein
LEKEPAPPVSTPKDTVSTEFMKLLIKIQTELLLDNISLLNNLRELGDKVIYRITDLKQMIEILTETPFKDIEITTEDPPVKCGCKVPIYTKIKSISLRKTTQFLNSDIATRLQEEFRISLEFAVPL